MAGGRPRTFDADASLDRAVDVFWQQGYEGTTISELTAAMGVNKPSLYAVFGTKEQLFQQVVRRYAERELAYFGEALAQPTAVEVVRDYLDRNAAALTRSDRPRGCLSIQGGLASNPANSTVTQFLASSRLAGERALAARLTQARIDGDLPADSDPAALARFVMVVSEGQAVHAAAGATHQELQQSADIALKAFELALTPAS
ncbi:TetR/AcrR family transcriptional regulator [Nocardioides houyundeii]|uniref:TetR/AcrR family transcriptional regulator n=1 Tax=Nocardioides houyundeii TaxID=2045452 RepID=UPI000DF37C67|nr:TetR/AcrR family transcriptional regulator [Nocardioides houyundeii]